MSDDDLVAGAQKQFKNLAAERKRAEYHLSAYQSEANHEGIAEQLQEIANIDRATENLTNLARRYEAANRPPVQRNPTQGERVERFGQTDVPPDWRDALAVINNGSQTPISEADYIEGYHRMKANDSTRGREQK